MSIYTGNNLEDRLEALETENTSLRKYNEYHQVVHEIDHMSDLHVDSSFHKESIKLDNYSKINEWIDHSIGQSTVIQQLNKKRPKLSNSNQTQNRRRYNKKRSHTQLDSRKQVIAFQDRVMTINIKEAQHPLK